MSKKSNVLTLIVAFLVTFQVALAQGITPEDISTLKNVTSSIISEDGNHVAYTLSVPADPIKENLTSKNHLYVLNTKTGETKAYFTTASVRKLSFRPQYGTLTFLTKRTDDKHTSIYELALDGGEANKVFSYTSNVVDYQWNSTGKQILFTTVEKQKSPKNELVYQPHFYEETFGHRKAYIHNLDTKTTQEIIVKGEVYMISWSPDNTKIALTVSPTTAVDDSYMKQKIVVLDAATHKIIMKVANEGKLGQIVWSPDSKKLALRAAKDLHDPIDGNLLIVSATTGGKPINLDVDFKGKYEQIAWDNAKTIHFLASVGTASMIGSIQPDGKNKKTIYKNDAQAIRSFSKNKENTFSFVANTPTHPNALFTLSNKRKAKAEKRTHHNPWLAERKLGKQEVVRYKARDGKYEIEGMLIYPVNYNEGTKVPLITVVHGGPESHYLNGWLTAYSMPGQAAAARGYAVFYPNYRGSTGRGNEFTYSSQGDMGGKEFDDIVDGVDYLIEKGIADKKRVGVTGGSYGGYASAWMSTYYSDRFAASVMFVGISNNLSKWGTSDIPEELFLVHSRKRLWKDWEGYLKTSPVYYVDKAQTPILIMHGAEDPRVHPAQSMELYRHIKVRKPEVPVRLIYYPGEGHGNRRSGSQYDYNLRMLQWFDTYLKTGNATAEKPNLDLPVLD